MLGEPRGERRGRLARLALAERERAEPAGDEERGERRDDAAEPLHDEVADARDVVRRAQNDAADGVAVPAERLGHRVDDEVDAEGERRLREGRREGVVGDA